MTLWQEIFSPKPIDPFTVQPGEFNKAWNWLMIQPPMALFIVRRKSIELHRQGVKNSAEMAAVGLWKRFTSQDSNPDTKQPSKAMQAPGRRV